MKRQRGFTLIELMITLAIVAIVAAIAYPSYTESVRKSRRADARAVLLEAAQYMERRYTQNLTGGYNAVVQADLNAAGLGNSPKDGATKYYQIILGTTPTTFTLTAQAQGAQINDSCGNLSLTNTGAKNQTGAGKTVDDCWR
ncbi:MAG: prepilin-type N-terminal cleavage/methylation domain-containing protein [Candidatus Competibacteraceae bacterium]|nr:prepilin-type N-terminal cleavage/methylation domain-containing protein [Candidatus Competibacteraceae bacterium]